ncbi:hypothetical protein OKW45_001935 [Paraburkholderia sp. WSM4175]
MVLKVGAQQPRVALQRRYLGAWPADRPTGLPFNESTWALRFFHSTSPRY